MAAGGVRTFGTMLVDTYPKGRFEDQIYAEGQDPFDIASWFDSANYSFSRNPEMRLSRFCLAKASSSAFRASAVVNAS
jgi:hypothetical protein